MSKRIKEIVKNYDDDIKFVLEKLSIFERNYYYLIELEFPVTSFIELIAIYHFYKTVADSIKYFTDRYLENSEFKNIKNKVINLSIRFLEYYILCERNKELSIIKIFAQVYVKTYKNMYLEDGFNYNPLIFDEYHNSVIIDLASGPDFINFIDLAPINNKYYTVDPSIFVAECIKYKNSLSEFPKDINIIVSTNEDFLNKSQNLINSVDCIRMKNVFAYDFSMQYLIVFYINLLRNNGKLVLLELSMQKVYDQYFNDQKFIDTCLNIIKEGTTFEFRKNNLSNYLAFDSLIFTKKENYCQTEIEQEIFRFKLLKQSIVNSFNEGVIPIT